MTDLLAIENIAGLVIAAVLLCYLLHSLVFPDRY
ncbi:potassium-transporting ATPase subunit F [Naumannella huperziae]